MARVLIGVDVGGTFTDAVAIRDGRWHTAKVPTTRDQDDGVMAAVAAALEAAGAQPADVAAFGHGTTTGTNALLERRGARTAFVTTRGFEHTLHLARQTRRELYHPCAPNPAPLVALDDCHGVDERTGPDGPEQSLDEEVVEELAAHLAASGIEAVALSLLHGYRHQEHERRVAELLRAALPREVPVSAAHELVPELREYERASTVAVDAYLGPVMSRYLGRLGQRSVEEGLPEPAIVRSSGGLARPADVAAHPAWAVLSGPAAGAAGAALLGHRAGAEHLITFDMGGTSCDVAVAGPAGIERGVEGTIDGLPVRLPMLDLATVGAGGGSIADLDPGGALRVGPASAGADPGPACYGRGGDRPTVTDAHAVLGHLPDVLAGGIRVDREAAAAVLEPLAARLGLDLEATAEGILTVAEAGLVRAVRLMTVERGRDPRDHALVAFGGAGPMHACRVADELEIERVLVPSAGGVLSALGAALGERRVDRSRAVLVHAGEAGEHAVRETVRELATEAGHELHDPDATREVVLDLRLRGQAFELSVPADDGLDAAVAAFHDEHERRYGFADRGGQVEIVTARLALHTGGPDPGRPATVDPRPVTGPDRVDLGEATCLVPAGWSGAFDADGILDLRRSR